MAGGRSVADELSADEVSARVEEFERRRDGFEERFQTSDPTNVNVFDHAEHARIHELMEAVSEWRSIDRDVRLYELARRIESNDGHVVPV